MESAHHLRCRGAGVVVRFRIAVDGADKFRWRKGSKPCLYGLNRLRAACAIGAVTLVEGESDCHTLWRAGVPAIGLPGAATWRSALARRRVAATLPPRIRSTADAVRTAVDAQGPEVKGGG